jgi:hypothetical protein
LGHTISTEGVAVDPEKIKETMDRIASQNVIDVRSSVGLVGYYRRFIRDLPRSVIPLPH